MTGLARSAQGSEQRDGAADPLCWVAAPSACGEGCGCRWCTGVVFAEARADEAHRAGYEGWLDAVEQGEVRARGKVLTQVVAPYQAELPPEADPRQMAFLCGACGEVLRDADLAAGRHPGPECEGQF